MRFQRRILDARDREQDGRQRQQADGVAVERPRRRGERDEERDGEGEQGEEGSPRRRVEQRVALPERPGETQKGEDRRPGERVSAREMELVAEVLREGVERLARLAHQQEVGPRSVQDGDRHGGLHATQPRRAIELQDERARQERDARRGERQRVGVEQHGDGGDEADERAAPAASQAVEAVDRPDRAEHEEAVVAGLPHVEEERHGERQERHREHGHPAIAEQQERERMHGRHRGDAEEGERQAGRERRLAEQRERSGRQVLLEPRGPAPHVARSVLAADLLRDQRPAVVGLGNAVDEDVAAEERGFGLVHPQQTLVQADEDQRDGDEEHGDGGSARRTAGHRQPSSWTSGRLSCAFTGPGSGSGILNTSRAPARSSPPSRSAQSLEIRTGRPSVRTARGGRQRLQRTVERREENLPDDPHPAARAKRALDAVELGLYAGFAARHPLRHLRHGAVGIP